MIIFQCGSDILCLINSLACNASIPSSTNGLTLQRPAHERALVASILGAVSDAARKDGLLSCLVGTAEVRATAQRLTKGDELALLGTARCEHMGVDAVAATAAATWTAAGS